MTTLPDEVRKIHERALDLSIKYKKSEADLLDVISAVREEKIYRYFECASIFEYCVKILKLDAGIVYGFTVVAKKINEVPELKEKIREGELNVSTAKRIVTVLTAENKKDWFDKAKTLTARKLEKEVAKANPKTEVKEKASYLNSKRVKLEFGISEKLMLEIRRIQDLESQKQRRSLNLEETMAAMAQVYLTKNDPVEKAKRASVRGNIIKERMQVQNQNSSPSRNDNKNQNPITQRQRNLPTWKNLPLKQSLQQPKKLSQQLHKPPQRRPVPAQIIHQINLRDHGKCQFINTHTKEKCEHRRFLEIHHRRPIIEGGNNDIENLITLCSEHHKIAHEGYHLLNTSADYTYPSGSLNQLPNRL